MDAQYGYDVVPARLFTQPTSTLCQDAPPRHSPASQSCTLRDGQMLATLEIRCVPPKNEALRVPDSRTNHSETASGTSPQILGCVWEGAHQRSPFPAALGRRRTLRASVARAPKPARERGP